MFDSTFRRKWSINYVKIKLRTTNSIVLLKTLTDIIKRTIKNMGSLRIVSDTVKGTEHRITAFRSPGSLGTFLIVKK